MNCCVICFEDIKNPIQLNEYYDCKCKEKYYHLDCFIQHIHKGKDKCPTCNTKKKNSLIKQYNSPHRVVYRRSVRPLTDADYIWSFLHGFMVSACRSVAFLSIMKYAFVMGNKIRKS